METLWFRARSYGWGWTPVTVQGWLVLALFIAAVFVDIAVFSHRLKSGVDHRTAMIAFLGWLAVLVAALIATCWLTGERPRWHWGNR